MICSQFRSGGDYETCGIPLILVALLLVSCAKNPFSTRDSEPPTGKAGTFIPPTTPQIVLENLRFCYQELVIGNFIQCLDSDFLFQFDFIQGAQTDSSWGYAREVSLTEKLFNDFNAPKATRSMRVTSARSWTSRILFWIPWRRWFAVTR